MQNTLSKTIGLFLPLFLSFALVVAFIPSAAFASVGDESNVSRSSRFSESTADSAADRSGGSEENPVESDGIDGANESDKTSDIQGDVTSSKDLPVAEDPSGLEADGESANEGISALASSITLDVSASALRCGSPVTFTLNASGTTNEVRYMVNGIYRYDGDFGRNGMVDPSFNASKPYIEGGTVEENTGKYSPYNTYDFTFYASGTYEIYFYAMDMATFSYVRNIYKFTIDDAAYPTIESKADSLAAQCKRETDGSDYEMALWMHDWLVNNNTYDYDLFYCGPEGVLARGKGTCASFQDAYTMLLSRVGIQSEAIESRGSDQHVWTNVNMDGKWYEVDTTWDCTPSLSDAFPDVRHLFFGITQDINILVRKSYTGNPSGNIADSLDNNYFIRSREILKYSDPYISQVQSHIDNGDTEFSLSAINSFWPDNYKNVIYNLVAYELGQTQWRYGGKSVDVKATYSAGVLKFSVALPFEVTVEKASDEMTVKVKASGAVLSRAQAVFFPTWSDAGGQDDIVWYEASRDGAYWVFTADIANYHKSAGSYSVHCYATVDGVQQFVGATTFGITPPSAKVEILQTEDQKRYGEFSVRVSDVVCPSGIRYIQAPTWSVENGQDDIDWMTLDRVSEGVWEKSATCTTGVRAPGTYISHIYVMANNGVSSNAAGISADVKLDDPLIDAVVDANEMGVTLRASGGILESAQSVQFPTWSNAGGQDDIVWYQASKQGRDWVARADIAAFHKTPGSYSVHCYATGSYGTRFATCTQFEISTPSADVILDQTPNDRDTGRFTTRVSNVQSPSGVSYIQSPTWSEAGGQDDIDWSVMTQVSSGVYEKTHSSVAANRDPGIYNSHVYLMAGNGVYVCVGCKSLDVKLNPSSFEADVDASEMGVTLRGFGGMLESAQSVQFPTWSNAGGQDDIVWYQASKQGRDWVARADIAAFHKTPGSYSVHCYATFGGVSKFVGAVSFDIAPPSADVAVEKTGEHTFKVTVSNVVSPSGVAQVRVPIWTVSDQSDICWYNATKTGSDTWFVDVDIRNHRAGNSVFNIHTYVSTGNSMMCFVDGRAFDMS